MAADMVEGDEIVVDGGMVRFSVLGKVGPDVRCQVIDPGLLLPRANLTFFRQGRLVRERNAMLPTISAKVRCTSRTYRREIIYLHANISLFLVQLTGLD